MQVGIYVSNYVDKYVNQYVGGYATVINSNYLYVVIFYFTTLYPVYHINIYIEILK
jgi:hypothetical protein